MEGIEWVDAKDGEVPENAVEGGKDGDVVLYVGRGPLFGDLIPGRVTENVSCLISYGGEGYNSTEYQVLVKSDGLVFDWVSASEGKVPDNAVPGGNTEEGEPLYVGRAVHDEAMLNGKIHPSHGVLYIFHCEQEIGVGEYEVLICKKADEEEAAGDAEKEAEAPAEPEESGEPPEEGAEPEA